MDNILWEDYQAAVDPPHSRELGGFYFTLQLYQLSRDLTVKLRDQAQAVLDQQGDAERQVVLQTFTFIRDRAQQRLERATGGNVILCFVQPHPTDSWEAIYDDRARTINSARQYAEASEPALAAVWGKVALGFDLMQFRQPTAPPG